MLRRTKPPIRHSFSVMECSLTRHDGDALLASCLTNAIYSHPRLRRFAGYCTLAGHTDPQSGRCRAQAGHDVAFVWPSLQTLERLRADYSLGDKPAVAKAGGLSRPLAGECPARRRKLGSLIRRISSHPLCRSAGRSHRRHRRALRQLRPALSPAAVSRNAMLSSTSKTWSFLAPNFPLAAGCEATALLASIFSAGL